MRLLNIREASEILGVSSVTLRSWREKGQGPEYIQMDGKVKYDSGKLDEWMKPTTSPKYILRKNRNRY